VLTGTRFYDFQPVYIEPIPSHCPHHKPQALVPSGEYIKTYGEQSNRRNLHIWNSHAH